MTDRGLRRFHDNRSEHVGVLRGNRVVEGSIGGWGPWTIDPPLVSTDGLVPGGEYVSTPLPMTQEELRAQHEWAMQRSDRKHLRPEIVAAGE